MFKSKYEQKIVCAICGEETAGTPSYSFYGSAHKWGPRNHKFKPRIIYVEKEES
jgi:hypothetical protein